MVLRKSVSLSYFNTLVSSYIRNVDLLIVEETFVNF